MRQIDDLLHVNGNITINGGGTACMDEIGKKPKIIVIGAGTSGLRAADVLLQRGCEVHVLEARDRIGGRVSSIPFLLRFSLLSSRDRLVQHRSLGSLSTCMSDEL